MEAKEFLGQVRHLKEMIKSKKMELAEMRANMYDGAHDNSGVRVQTTPTGDAMEKRIIDVADMEAEICDSITDYYTKYHEVINIINRLSRGRYIMVIRERWICDKTLETIAQENNYSFSTIRHDYWKAMKEMEEIIENMNTN